MVFGQDGGVLAPPRGAWNGVEGAELLQWGCADGNAQVWLLRADALHTESIATVLQTCRRWMLFGRLTVAGCVWLASRFADEPDPGGSPDDV